MELWQNGKVEFYHMPMKQYLFAVILSFLISIPGQAELPGSFSAIYSLHFDDLRVGVMERHFIHKEDGSGTFESNGKLTGLAALFRKDQINETSRWEMKDGNLRPVVYKYERTGGDSLKKEVHRFDWNKNTISSVTETGKNKLPLKPGLLDKLLYQLAIMQIKDPKAGLSYDLIDGTDLKNYQFEFMGEEELSTPMGKLKSYKFQRKRDDQNIKEGTKDTTQKIAKRSTIIWCAPSLHYLPIRVDSIDKKGHLTSIIIKSVEGLN
ncbi:MAG: DUF3108 domain-containing protein [Gammaproteobacteria bacterium]